MAIALIIALLVAGGITVGAENSAPGDLLYPVKVGITEEVRSGLAFGSEAEGELQASFAGRRLDELQNLSAEGSVTADVAAELESRFEAHAEAVYQAIADLRAEADFEGAADVAAAFENELDARSSALAELRGTVSAEVSGSGTAEARIRDIADKALVFRVRSQNLRLESEAQVSANAEGSATTSGGTETRTSGGVNVDINAGGEATTGTSSTKSEGSVEGGIRIEL